GKRNRRWWTNGRSGYLQSGVELSRRYGDGGEHRSAGRVGAGAALCAVLSCGAEPVAGVASVELHHQTRVSRRGGEVLLRCLAVCVCAAVGRVACYLRAA